jgi:hypothetical protein
MLQNSRVATENSVWPSNARQPAVTIFVAIPPELIKVYNQATSLTLRYNTLVSPRTEYAEGGDSPSCRQHLEMSAVMAKTGKLSSKSVIRNDNPEKTKLQGFIRLGFELSVNPGDSEPSRFVKTYDGKVLFYEEDNEGNDSEEVEIGKFKVFHVQVGNAMNQGVPLEDVMDAHSQEVFEYYETLFEEGQWKPVLEELCADSISFDLLVIHTVEVLPEYRGHNLGLAHCVSHRGRTRN